MNTNTIVDSVIVNNYLEDVKDALDKSETVEIADHVPPEVYPKIIEQFVKNVGVKSINIGDERLIGDIILTTTGDAHFSVTGEGENKIVGINVPLAETAKTIADIALTSVTWDDSE